MEKDDVDYSSQKKRKTNEQVSRLSRPSRDALKTKTDEADFRSDVEVTDR